MEFEFFNYSCSSAEVSTELMLVLVPLSSLGKVSKSYPSSSSGISPMAVILHVSYEGTRMFVKMPLGSIVQQSEKPLV